MSSINLINSPEIIDLNTDYMHSYVSYEDSLYLNVNYWSYNSNFDKLSIYLLNKLKYKQSNKNITSLKLLLINLYKNYLNNNFYTAYHRSHSGTYGIERYNKLKVGRKIIIKSVDLLRELHLVEHKMGFYSHNEYLDNTSRVSRIRANSELIHIMESKFNINKSMVCRLEDEEVLYYKDKDKNLIPYTDSKRTITMRNKVTKYNNLLSSSVISIDWNYVDRDECKVDLLSKKVHRVFNRSSWSLGGRYYGAFWMHINKHARKHILINGNPTVELDYDGLHINILYALEGINYEQGKDVYDIPGYEITNNPKLRKVAKSLLLMNLNSDSKGSCLKAIHKELRINPDDYPEEKPDLNKLLDDFAEHHAPIAGYMCSGIGRKLQFRDSQITEYILKVMTSKGIPVLSVHDSYICEKQHEELLRGLMDEAYIKILGKDFPDIKPPSVTREEADLEKELPVCEIRKIFKELSFSTLGFGKYKEKSLPWLLFNDPDHLFWAYNKKGRLKGKQRNEAKELLKRARFIKIPNGGSWVAEYSIDPCTNKFEGLRIVSKDEISEILQGKTYRSTIDLIIPSQASKYDKEGNRKMLSQVKETLFGDKDFEVSEEFSKEFFNNSDNFIYKNESFYNIYKKVA